MKGWTVTRDPGGRMGPYAAFEDQWVSFDDDYMVRHKSEYVRAMGLGGAMAWALDLDDFTGRYCGCGKSPLLKTINFVLRDKEMPQRCSLEEIHAATPVETVAEKPTERPIMETEDIPSKPQEVQHDEVTVTSLDGKSCSGTVFRADESDCSKYYLCINGEFMQLSCPEPLHWNKNHCDWPEKSRCKTKAQLRITGQSNPETQEDKPIVACYFTNWAYYRQGNGSYGPSQVVDPLLCTHIVYSWAHLDGATHKVVPGIPELDIENDFYGKMTELRQTGIQMILGVGGLSDSQDEKWREMTSTAENRRVFIDSVFKVLQKWKFDGVQIAWQYPVCKQVPCTDVSRHTSDRDNFAELLTELSKILRYYDLEVSAMVSANPEIAALAYKHHVLTTELDWVSIAANDYFASTSGRTAYLVPLESSDVAGVNSFNSSLSYWSSVVPARKLVLGVPAYARSYSLRSGASSAVGAPVSGPGEPGEFTQVPGLLAYYEMCRGLRSREWKEIITEEGTYGVSGRQWASYLRAAEVHRVGAAAAAAGARGAALWALDLDDWRGQCACAPAPLLTALRQGLLDPAIPPTLCLYN